jgi:hypothetical protein
VTTDHCLIGRLAEYVPKQEADDLPRGTRGIYALFRHRGIGKVYDVVYVGLSQTGIRSRLRAHRRSRKIRRRTPSGHARPKGKIWTHFSVFEVHQEATDEQISELEGLFRHVYRRDTHANWLNRQKIHGPLKARREQDLKKWPPKTHQDVLKERRARERTA